MKRINVLIVDDEPIMCEELRSQLEVYPEINTLAVCHNGEETLAKAAELKPDALFLDIQMPGINGLIVADVLSRQKRAPKVIFLTAHDEYALKAFGVDALDYVLKPYDEHDIKRIVTKLNKLFSPQDASDLADMTPAAPDYEGGCTRKFCVQQGTKLEVVDQEQIQLFFAKNRLVFIQTTDETSHAINFSLNELMSKLDPKLFIRCHRNYIVNINQIKSLENWFNRGYLLLLKGKNKTEIPVSRQYVKHLKIHLEF